MYESGSTSEYTPGYAYYRVRVVESGGPLALGICFSPWNVKTSSRWQPNWP